MLLFSLRMYCLLVHDRKVGLDATTELINLFHTQIYFPKYTIDAINYPNKHLC